MNSTLNALPAGVAELLDAMPRSGGGVHNWLFRVARRLHGHMAPVAIEGLLRERVAHCGRRVPQREIASAVRRSAACAPRGSKGGRKSTSNRPGVSVSVSYRRDSNREMSLYASETGNGNGDSPTCSMGVRVPVDHALREGIIHSQCVSQRGCGGLAELWELSPVRLDECLDGEQSMAERIIDLFFPGNPLLCCGSGPAKFATRLREDWRGRLSAMALIVPSPMSAVKGLTQDGRASSHTLANTGPRRFLVCEFDSGHGDEHAALLWHLSQVAPLVCAVHSGGKSVHGWFFVQHFSEEQACHFFRNAVRIGADPATWTRSQFVRMPDGCRDNGRRQTVFYLNPEPLTPYYYNNMDNNYIINSSIYINNKQIYEYSSTNSGGN